MSTIIRLNLINESNDQNISEIVIFQKNVAADFDEVAVAWQVIRNLGQGSYHSFTYPSQSYVCTSISRGDFTPQVAASNGQAFYLKFHGTGEVLEYYGPAANSQAIEIVNNPQPGAINAHVYKDGKLLAVKTGVAPGEKAAFEFMPNLFIGVVPQVKEGQIMDSAMISKATTKISLLGIRSANIVMTGGGVDSNAHPLTFTVSLM